MDKEIEIKVLEMIWDKTGELEEKDRVRVQAIHKIFYEALGSEFEKLTEEFSKRPFFEKVILNEIKDKILNTKENQ